MSHRQQHIHPIWEKTKLHAFIFDLDDLREIGAMAPYCMESNQLQDRVTRAICSHPTHLRQHPEPAFSHLPTCSPIVGHGLRCRAFVYHYSHNLAVFDSKGVFKFTI